MGKQFGAIYLILGTCVAAGMLGLPVVAAENHFLLTTWMLFSAWALMSMGAWCLLQITLQMPPGSNMLSMAQKILGKKVKIVTWFVYLLLFYSLICAYLSASSDLLQHLFVMGHLGIPHVIATFLAVLILGGIVMQGIRSVDLSNRVLMSIKLVICLLVILSIMPYVHTAHLSEGALHWHYHPWLIMVCSFGYATILPSIRDYLGVDARQMNRVFFIGSVFPLLLYVVWIFAVQGALPREALLAMNHSANTNSLLMTSLVSLTHHAVIGLLSVVFISICAITGFFGVSVGLVDFIADGTGLKKQGIQKVLLAMMTFLPSTLIVIFDPSIFINALSYAGMCCLYILVILPITMYVKARVTAVN